MKHLDISSKNRPSPHWTKFALAGVLAAALAGCGGSDGANGAAGTPGAPGQQGQTGSNAVPAVQVAALTPALWADAKFTGTVTGVTIASPPVVSFKVTDAAGNPVVGLGNTSKSATATLAGYTNVVFTLVKLVPGANGSPSKWVSYIVTTVPTYKSATDKTIVAAAPTRPSTDNTGTLVDNGDGSYKYTFYRDITKIKADVAAMTVTAPSVLADLGDLAYDPALTHRLVIQISGNARGTGSNTADAVTLTPGVAMKNPINVIYDFIPATGKVVTASDPQREIVATAKCNECHSQIGVSTPHGGRVDTRYCVTCHNDQRKFGRAEATTTATGYSGSTYTIGGMAVGNFPVYIHKIHMGKELTKTGYNYANVLFNEVTYPQPITNCVKCHDGSATSTAKTTQGDNWKNVPNRAACGACHDGINFATGGGTNLSGTYAGHIGGAKADDKLCATCHDAAAIPTYHVTVDPTGSNGRGGYPLNTADNVPTVGYASGQGPSIPVASQLGTLPAGVYKMNFELKQVTVAGAAGAKKATVVYRILKDGAPVTLNATGMLLNNVDGTPSIYVAYALPQDGLATPADWNASISATVLDIRNAKASAGTQTGPDANGFYTATLAAVVPDAAKMVTGAMGINYSGFVQLGLAAYPKGIRLREPQFATKLADGFAPRRSIVANAKCNSCHGQLGVSPSFHSGARNNGEGCAICHQPNTPGGHGATGWSVAVKNMVHSIHSADKRRTDNANNAFSYQATAENPKGFDEVTYPGVLNNCEQCHVAGSYDFSTAANAAALPNLLWTTDTNGNMTAAPALGLSPWVTALGAGLTNYTTNNLVSSPIASSCFGCHGATTAVAHMQLNGGTLVSLASSASTGGARPAFPTASGVPAATTFSFTKVEACMVCHGAGKVADIKAVHMN